MSGPFVGGGRLLILLMDNLVALDDKRHHLLYFAIAHAQGVLKGFNTLESLADRLWQLTGRVNPVKRK